MDVRYEAARSNYVKIIDLDSLKHALEPFEIEIINGKNENDGRVCFVGCCKDGDYPNWVWRDDGEELEFTFEEYVVPYLADGETLVTVHIGTNNVNHAGGYVATYHKNMPAEIFPLSDDYSYAQNELTHQRQY